MSNCILNKKKYVHMRRSTSVGHQFVTRSVSHFLRESGCLFLSICMSVCFCLSVCLSACLSVVLLLDMRGGPVIEPFDQERTLPEGEKLKLTCKTTGNPRPSLQWYKDNAPLSPTDYDPYRHDPPTVLSAEYL